MWLRGQSPVQDTPLGKQFIISGFSFLTFEMEGAEFVKAAIKGCPEFPCNVPQEGRP